MKQILSASNLTVKYGDTVVLDKVTFAVEQQDFICVVGANGAGKSTLVRTILGLIEPDAGTIALEHDLDTVTVGYLPQEAKIDPDFPATVKEIVMSGNLGRMRARPFYSKAERNSTAKFLKMLGIEHLQHSSFTKLSGGQKQKVLLARALVAATKLLILDEPLSGLDHPSRVAFCKLLQDLNRRQELTIMMITHDIDAEDLVGNRVFAIANGTLKDYTTQDFLKGRK